MIHGKLPYRCPVCKLSLKLESRSLRCENRHCYDLAKEDYVNLLPVQQKKSLEPGDSSEMIQARQRFLNAGHYQTFAQGMQTLLNAKNLINGSLLDLGCGEGYYTQYLRKNWRGEMFALDISKPAIRLAAKRKQNINWSVASSFHAPFFDHSFDFILTVFAPTNPDEVRRLLKPGGYWLQANPGPNHLAGLKELIYDDVNAHEMIAIPNGFQRIEHQHIKSTLALENAEAIADLLLMTPFYWSLNQERQQAILGRSQLHTDITFLLTLDQAV